jgi:hypothetical protein
MNLISSFSDVGDEDDAAEEEEEKERKRRMSVNSRRGSVFSVVADRYTKPEPLGSSPTQGHGRGHGHDGTSANGSVDGQNTHADTEVPNIQSPTQPQTQQQQAKSKKKEDWTHEYQAGCDWEIYCTELASVFVGVKFVDLAYVIYARLGVVVFGVQIVDKVTKQIKVKLAVDRMLIISYCAQRFLRSF